MGSREVWSSGRLGFGRLMPAWGGPPRAALSRFRALTVGVLVTVVGALAIGVAPQARAATIDVTDFTVEVDRTEVTFEWAEAIKTTVNWCTPDSANAGDTFTLTLPEVLSSWPASFDIRDGTGAVVYSVQISTDSPAVATFTLTSYGAGLTNLCTRAEFTATSGSTAVGTYPLNYQLNGTVEYDVGTLTVVPVPLWAPTEPGKAGWAPDAADQCRTNPRDCITWRFNTGRGVQGVHSVSDPAQPNWKWNCANNNAIRYATVRTIDGSSYTDSDGSPYMSDINCTEGLLSFTVDTTSFGPNTFFFAELSANAAAPGGDGLETYSNTADLTVDGVGSQASWSWTSSYVGGSAEGDGIVIYKKDVSGNDANDHDSAVDLPDGSTELVFTIRNIGTNELTGVTVTDQVTEGNATVSDIVCTYPDDSTGPAGRPWAGPFQPGDSFQCTGQLSGVSGFSTDVATVTATGNGPVSSSNPYVGFTEPPEMDLALAKAVTSSGPYYEGSTVTFSLTPRNNGPADAAAGWSVTEVLPAGLTLVSMSGPGYTCTDASCVAAEGLAAETDGAPITVTTTIGADFAGPLKNVAYVAPADGDVPESNPLVVPTTTTDTSTSETNNDGVGG